MIFLSKQSLQKQLHNQKNFRVEKALKSFKEQNASDPLLDSKVTELRKRLDAEAVRIYPMVDESILKERIKRAKITTLITAALTLAGVLITGALFGIAITLFALTVPLVSSAVAGIASISTIGITYNARINGAMNSVKNVYEEELAKKKTTGINVQQCVNNGNNVRSLSYVDSVLNKQSRNLPHEIA